MTTDNEKGKLLKKIPKKLYEAHYKKGGMLLILSAILIYSISLFFKISDVLSDPMGLPTFCFLGPLVLICGIFLLISSYNTFDFEIYDTGLIVPTPRNRDFRKKVFIPYHKIKKIYVSIDALKEEELRIETFDNKKYYIASFFITPSIKKLIFDCHNKISKQKN
jgi:hypothetical protein